MAEPTHKRKNSKVPPPPLTIPNTDNTFKFTSSGTFVEADFSINKQGYSFDASRPSSSTSKSSDGEERMDASPRDFEVHLDDLQRVEVIGQGSSGVVEKMIHVHTRRLVALKVVPLDVTEKIRKQILLELKTLHECVCPYIVGFYGAFYQEGAINIALEYMDCGSLQDVLKAVGKIPENILGKMTIQVLKGLEYLHKTLKLIHRDIKPSNLLVNSRGDFKIADFGVSGQMENSVDVKISWVGTVTYMSPERIRGDTYQSDSDLWSLGLTLVECALGRFPYPPPGSSTTTLGFWDLLDFIVAEPAPTLPERFSPEFRSFVAQCLHKEPANRPTAHDLLGHPFILKYEADPTDLGEWIREVKPSIQNGRPSSRSSSLSSISLSSASLTVPSPVAHRR
eukprot:GILJ01006460.1.p1 GENE.GILJ01006460.1~~GILJ01006460.1.p1  ORF type:complete len:395 (+),score=49.26 GILJ01006460.1:109-1293(+)